MEKGTREKVEMRKGRGRRGKEWKWDEGGE